MIFICPSCGIKLEKDFKFCPNCGFDLSAPAEASDVKNGNGHNDSSHDEVIVCEVCGEENIPGNDFCVSCGAKLKGARKAAPKPAAKDVEPSQQKKQPKQIKKDKKTPSQSAAKAQQQSSLKLSTGQISAIAGGIIAIMFVILLATGTFESTPEPSALNNQVQTPAPGQSGVDLNTLQHINELEAKIKANPDDVESMLHLAHMKNDAGMFEKAIQDYKAYLAKIPENADARVDMGVCYYNLKNYPTAIAEMKKALEYKPKHQIAHLNLGIVNLTAGNLEDSKSWFRKTVEIDPNSDVGKRAKELLESH